MHNCGKYWCCFEIIYEILALLWNPLWNIGVVSKSSMNYWRCFEILYEILTLFRNHLWNIGVVLKSSMNYWRCFEIIYEILALFLNHLRIIRVVLKSSMKYWNMSVGGLISELKYVAGFFFVALQPNAGHGLLILEFSRSHTTTHHSR